MSKRRCMTTDKTDPIPTLSDKRIDEVLHLSTDILKRLSGSSLELEETINLFAQYNYFQEHEKMVAVAVAIQLHKDFSQDVVKKTPLETEYQKWLFLMLCERHNGLPLTRPSKQTIKQEPT